MVFMFCLKFYPLKTNKHYTYLAVPKSEVIKERETKIMFYKGVDSTGIKFKAVKTDISYVRYNNILEIVPNTTMKMKGNTTVVLDVNDTTSKVNLLLQDESYTRIFRDPTPRSEISSLIKFFSIPKDCHRSLIPKDCIVYPKFIKIDC